VASKYRKAKDEEAEEALKKEDREAAGYRSYGTQLFVDGLNVINKWPKLKKRLNRGEFALARALLEQDMDGVAAMRGWNVKIVYDGGGETENIASYDTTMPEYEYGKGMNAVFTGRNETADAFIERHVTYLKQEARVPMVIVATDDNLIRSMVAQVGGMYMSCSKLLSEVKIVQKETTVHIQRAKPVVPGHWRVQDMLSEEEIQALDDAVLEWNRQKRERADSDACEQDDEEKT